MPLDRADAISTHKAPHPAWLFFKRWLANPLTMASITPSSASLARVIANNVQRAPDEAVVEFGSGTGSITRGLLDSGIPGSRLFTVEIDRELVQFLRQQYPDVTVYEGDVRNIATMLPDAMRGKIGTVVVGIPMILLPQEAQQQIVDAIFSIMPKGRYFLAYTYSGRPPLKYRGLGLQAHRVGFTMANFPPASVWAFSKADA